MKPATTRTHCSYKNDKDVSQPMKSTSAIIQTMQNKPKRLYSLAINTIAPKCISSPISLTLPLPSGEDLTFKYTKYALNNPNNS